ncbi:amidohydrolase family protein [Ktedonospora formicarum]|uniref:5-methylthioadenosine/S-adenosylhomocysteine deaminase n=1 Tax=Ktedonospora formicarum TaxID=2778364 RepID=A0A8J3I0B4_9CHLR|nr:amidohydrolase family protein [Ktedonospora formicarum]GHO46461.1 5-methylthioadenosine/S-adenosylhomocysteine deaminase [Ktedonospora formicarum]
MHNPATYTLIQGCALLAPTEPNHLLYDQDILIIGNHIQEVGPAGTLCYNPLQIDRVLAGQDRLVIPGMINAHTHSLENVLKATSPSLPLELWLVPLFGNTFEWTPRMAYLSAALGALEMLKSGTTTVLDHLWTPSGVSEPFLNAVMQAYEDVGIRAAVAPSIEDQDLLLTSGLQQGFDFPEHPFTDRFDLWPPIEEQLDTLEQFIARWHNTASGRLRCLVGPSGIHWCSQTLLAHCNDLADHYETGLHIHAVETALQAQIIRDYLGKDGIAYLADQNVLRPGTSLAHAIWLAPGDLERIALSGATLVHNPVSNLRLGSGRFPLKRALDLGVSVSLGCDGSASNDNQNMFSVLKLAGLLHNYPRLDYKQWPSAAAIFSAATTGGASALGQSTELGTIASGQLADLVMLDLSSTAFLPLRDPYLHLVYCEPGPAVETVIVHGEVVVEQGHLTRLDETELAHEIRERCRHDLPDTPALPEPVANTQAVMAQIDTLRRLTLRRGKPAIAHLM